MEDYKHNSDLHPTNSLRFSENSSETLSLLSNSDSCKHQIEYALDFLSSGSSQQIVGDENKENMSDNKTGNDSVDSPDASFHLRLEETQNPTTESKTESSQSPTASGGEGKWSEKLKKLDKDKIKFQSSSSTSPIVSRGSLDESVIIEDSPEDRKNISVIDITQTSDIVISDSSLHLALDDTVNGSNSNGNNDNMTTPMSELLAPNALLYEDCDNIDNVIDNDEDMESMKDAAALLDYDHSKEVVRYYKLDRDKKDVYVNHICSDLLINKAQLAGSWSPKQKIWGSKRKAEAASLTSSEESSKKRLDARPGSEGSHSYRIIIYPSKAGHTL